MVEEVQNVFSKGQGLCFWMERGFTILSKAKRYVLASVVGGGTGRRSKVKVKLGQSRLGWVTESFY